MPLRGICIEMCKGKNKKKWKVYKEKGLVKQNGRWNPRLA